ncbi:hypothetical protein EV363DRAFT_1167383 [Boletus edulis]|nr:hypothetical protein EV363DRAFT_1167383 [Boletus edulis]
MGNSIPESRHCLTGQQFSWTTAPDQRRVRGPACCYSKPQCYEIATRSTDCTSLFQVRRRLNVPERPGDHRRALSIWTSITRT